MDNHSKLSEYRININLSIKLMQTQRSQHSGSTFRTRKDTYLSEKYPLKAKFLTEGREELTVNPFTDNTQILNPKRKQSDRNYQVLYEIYQKNFTTALEIQQQVMKTVEDNNKEIAQLRSQKPNIDALIKSGLKQIGQSLKKTIEDRIERMQRSLEAQINAQQQQICSIKQISEETFYQLQKMDEKIDRLCGRISDLERIKDPIRGTFSAPRNRFKK